MKSARHRMACLEEANPAWTRRVYVEPMTDSLPGPERSTHAVDADRVATADCPAPLSCLELLLRVATGWKSLNENLDSMTGVPVKLDLELKPETLPAK